MSNYNIYHFPPKEDAHRDPVRNRIRVTKESLENVINLLTHTIEFHRNVATDVIPKEYKCNALGVSYAGSRVHHKSVVESLPHAIDSAKLLAKAAQRDDASSGSATPDINIVSSFASSSRQASRGGTRVGGSASSSYHRDRSNSHKDPLPIPRGSALITIKVRTGSLESGVYSGGLQKPLEEWCFYCICATHPIMWSPEPSSAEHPSSEHLRSPHSSAHKREASIYANDPHQIHTLIEFVQENILNSCLIRGGEDVKALGALTADESVYTAAKTSPQAQSGGFFGKIMNSVFTSSTRKPIYFDVVAVHG